LTGAISELESPQPGNKKADPKVGFFCPKAGEELLLRGSSGSRSSSSGGGRSSGGGGGRSRGSGSSRSSSSSGSRSSGSGGSRSSSSSGSSFSGLRSFSSGLRCFNLGGFSRLRGFGLAASGHSQGEEGSYEERLLHVISFIDRGETWMKNLQSNAGCDPTTIKYSNNSRRRAIRMTAKRGIFCSQSPVVLSLRQGWDNCHNSSKRCRQGWM
jgi:hypothetical protein